MKYVVVLGDGMADEPLEDRNGKNRTKRNESGK